MTYVDRFRSTNEFDSPKPGEFWAAIQVHACAGTDSLHVNPFDFYLIEPDDSHIQYGDGPVEGKAPELNDTTLQPKECVTGWVNYAVQAKPKSVALDNSDLRWVIP